MGRKIVILILGNAYLKISIFPMGESQIWLSDFLIIRWKEPQDSCFWLATNKQGHEERAYPKVLVVAGVSHKFEFVLGLWIFWWFNVKKRKTCLASRFILSTRYQQARSWGEVHVFFHPRDFIQRKCSHEVEGFSTTAPTNSQVSVLWNLSA